MRFNTLKKITVSTGLLFMISCGGSSGGSDDAASLALQTEQKAILSQFANAVIVPTYEDLATKSAAMKEAATAFAADQTQEKLDATRDAWVATRVPWERSEAFLFGPVDSNGYDPQMDDWPLDHSKLEQTIAANASSPIDVATAETDIKGFHSIEFLLWGFNKSKVVASMTAAEGSYLTALVSDHARITSLLRDAWTSGTTPYATVLTSAGDTGNDTYASTQSGIQEMFDAMVGIADEVANSKISGPYKDQDSNKVESQFSYNSLIDFQNNITSLRNVYFGTLDGTVATASISNFVKSHDPILDAEVTAGIAASIEAIGQIPEPFRDSLKDPTAAASIDAAITTINDLMTLLDTKVRPIVLP